MDVRTQCQGFGMPVWKWQHDIEDCVIALQAAQQMAERLGVDIAIMSDLSVIPKKQATEIPLEVVRATENNTV